MAVNSLGTARYQHFHSLATDRFFLPYLESPLIFVAVSGQLLAKALNSLVRRAFGNVLFTLVFKVDGDSGDIVSSLHATNGAVRFIAEAFIMDRLCSK